MLGIFTPKVFHFSRQQCIERSLAFSSHIAKIKENLPENFRRQESGSQKYRSINMNLKALFQIKDSFETWDSKGVKDFKTNMDELKDKMTLLRPELKTPEERKRLEFGSSFKRLMKSGDEAKEIVGLDIKYVSDEVIHYLFKSSGIKHARFQYNRRFPALETRNEMEIEIFCPNPLAIMDCTLCLDIDDLYKVEDFIKIKHFLESLPDNKGPALAIFAARYVHEDLKDQVRELLSDAKIFFIDFDAEEKPVDDEYIKMLTKKNPTKESKTSDDDTSCKEVLAENNSLIESKSSAVVDNTKEASNTPTEAKPSSFIWDLMYAGRGEGLAKTFGRFLRYMYESSGIPHSKFQYERRFPVPKDWILATGANEIELDVFCESPLTIVETIKFIGYYDLKEVDKIIKKKNVMEAQYGPSKTILVVEDLHDRVKDEVRAKLAAEGIELIDCSEEIVNDWEYNKDDTRLQ